MRVEIAFDSRTWIDVSADVEDHGLTMCPHARIHPAQDWPHGPIVDRCRDCGRVLERKAA